MQKWPPSYFGESFLLHNYLDVVRKKHLQLINENAIFVHLLYQNINNKLIRRKSFNLQEAV